MGWNQWKTVGIGTEREGMVEYTWYLAGSSGGTTAGMATSEAAGIVIFQIRGMSVLLEMFRCRTAQLAGLFSTGTGLVRV